MKDCNYQPMPAGAYPSRKCNLPRTARMTSRDFCSQQVPRHGLQVQHTAAHWSLSGSVLVLLSLPHEPSQVDSSCAHYRAFTGDKGWHKGALQSCAGIA